VTMEKIIFNKKGELSGLAQTILWVILFAALSVGIYFFRKRLFNLG